MNVCLRFKYKKLLHGSFETSTGQLSMWFVNTQFCHHELLTPSLHVLEQPWSTSPLCGPGTGVKLSHTCCNSAAPQRIRQSPELGTSYAVCSLHGWARLLAPLESACSQQPVGTQHPSSPHRVHAWHLHRPAPGPAWHGGFPW